jgi:hypothetical protein
MENLRFGPFWSKGIHKCMHPLVFRHLWLQQQSTAHRDNEWLSKGLYNQLRCDQDTILGIKLLHMYVDKKTLSRDAVNWYNQ